MHRPRQKPLVQNLSRSEQKAAQIDNWVRGHIARSREAEKAKSSHLKALREAHEAAVSQTKPRDEEQKGPATRQVQRMRRMWISAADAASDPKSRDNSRK
jgi:hypothetical protein